MPKNVYKWLHFSFWERWAVIFLALLAIGFNFFNDWNPSVTPPLVTLQILSDSGSDNPPKQWSSKHADNYPTASRRTIASPSNTLLHNLHSFDPNQITVDSLLLMGLPSKLVATLDHFRQKGGRFRTREDLQKVYGLTPTLFRQLAPYVEINSETKKTVNRFVRETLPEQKRSFLQIDVNKADSVAWESLPGIGPALAGRIIRFRDRLGGFYKIEQIAETFGVADSVYQRIAPYLRIENTSVELIPINTATWDMLRAHPYVGGKMASALLQYRKQHGPFQQSEDILSVMSITPEQLHKLKPYLLFD